MTREGMIARVIEFKAQCPYCFTPLTGAEIRFDMNPEGTLVLIDSGEQYVDFVCEYCQHVSDLASAISPNGNVWTLGKTETVY